MKGRSGRRGFLRLASAAALLPVAHNAAAEVRLRPVVPTPSGFEEVGPDHPMWRVEAERVAADGRAVIACFISADGSGFTWTVNVRAGAADDTAPSFRTAVDAMEASLASRDATDGPGRPFGIFTDLRLERRIVTDDALFWLGHWSGIGPDSRAEGLVVEGLLRVGGRTIGFQAVGGRPPGEATATAAAENLPIPGGGGFAIWPLVPFGDRKRRSLAADPGRVWLVLHGWVDAVRIANGLPALTVHDFAGIAVTIPEPAGFVRVPLDPQVWAGDPRYPSITFVLRNETIAARDRTSIHVIPRSDAQVMAAARGQFETVVALLGSVAADTPSFKGLVDAGAGEVTLLIGSAENRDSFAMLAFRRDSGGPSYLDGQARLWVTGLGFDVIVTSQTMAADDATIRHAWQVFRDWVAAVVAANGGA